MLKQEIDIADKAKAGGNQEGWAATRHNPPCSQRIFSIPKRTGCVSMSGIRLIMILLPEKIARLTSAALLWLVGAWSLSAAPVDFVREVQPIFAARCYDCHGEAKQESSLRLDSRENTFKGGYHGPAVVPGDSAKSVLYQVITATHKELDPMPKKGGRLSEQQVALIKTWIDQGAVWPESASVKVASTSKEHWAFKAPELPALPKVKNKRWVENPIDRFVLAKLEHERIKPSLEADKVTLLRRLSLDLIGLPPTPAEVDAFLADRSKDAYEKQVERLLNSPHYGERWARVWLDGARYADSDGFEKDKPRDVWFYRDWVINAFNRDLPYNEFVIEQLAGDLLPNATQDQRVATGFLRNSMINEEGGVHPEQFRMEAMFDRLDAIGKSMLGLTIQCAQCHDHKYDPIAQSEYYQLFAFINDSAEGSINVYSPEQNMQRAQLLGEIAKLEEDLKHRTPDWEKKLAAWETQTKAKAPQWTILPLGNSGDNAQRYYDFPDGSLMASGYAPTRFSSVFTNTVTAREIRAFRLEMMTDKNLPAQGPGRSVDGLFALTEFKVEAEDAANPGKKKAVKFVNAVADYSNDKQTLPEIYQGGYKTNELRVTGPASYAIDGDNKTAWGIDAGPGQRNQDRTAIFIAEDNVAFPKGTKFTVQLVQQHGGKNSNQNQNLNVGKFRVSFAGEIKEEPAPLPNHIAKILDTPREKRTRLQQADLFSYWRQQVPEWQATNERIAALWKQHPDSSTQMVLQRMDDPRDTFLLKRGDIMKPDRKVQPGVPAVLNPLPRNADGSRLTLARWLVDPKSPTAARSIVNRVWQTYFGIGIVETSEDLGVQSPAPSHPELLDWLSVTFMDEEWSLKKLHQLIVTSATYRQSSKVTPEQYALDPNNRLLARGARFRVEAELVRDIALTASGLLNHKVGGPSVYPPIPEFLILPPASYGEKVWDEEKGDNRYRRSLYTFRYRSVPYPILQAFDAPNGDFSCVRRGRSNTPLQALMTLNDPISMEAAQALARRVLRDGGSTEISRLEYAFRCCVSRKPTKEELKELEALLDNQVARFNDKDAKPLELAASDEIKLPAAPKDISDARLAAWTAVSRVLLNLDETITKE